MPLNLDYRPQSFDGLFGNVSTIASLKSIYEDRGSDFPRAVLLQGARGSGKTTTARIIANILLGKPYKKCSMDFTQIDGANIKVETVRQIKNLAGHRPMNAKTRVWIFEEAHTCGQGGASEKNQPQNNLLTLLEEPPGKSYFILCTTDPQRLLGTIRSRCHTFEMKYLRRNEMLDLLKDVLAKEDISDIPEETLKKVHEASDGCPRDALKILDQIIDMDPKEMEGAISSFFYGEKSTADLCKALQSGQSWNKVRLMLNQMDLSNPETIRKGITTWMANSLLKEDDPVSAIIYDNFEKPFYDNGKPGFIVAVYKALIDVNDVKEIPF